MNAFKITPRIQHQQKVESFWSHHLKNGIIANLHGILAESPQLYKAYRELGDLFTASSFNTEEQTVEWRV